MESRIRELNYLEYFFSFAGCRSALSDFYVDCYRDCAHILGASLSDGRPAGLLIWAGKQGTAELLYIFVPESERRRGTGKALVKFSQDQIRAEDGSWEMTGRIQKDGPEYEGLKALYEGAGFSMEDQLKVFQAHMKDYPVWERYMEKHGRALERYLLEEGFSPVSFEEAPRRALDQILDMESGRFDRSLDPAPVLEGRKGDFRQDLSFLSVKDGQAAAYCLVTQPDAESIVYEIFSVAEEYRSCGVILQPFLNSMKELKKTKIRRIGFAVFASNSKALALTGRLMRNLISRTEIQYIYRWVKEE